MDVEESYVGVSWFFDIWVRAMEAQPRRMEAQDAQLKDSRVLIVSPPTDAGMEILTRANAHGESYLLCFSKSLERIARHYISQHSIGNLTVCVGGFFDIPFDDTYFDAIFANCFFDFCRERDFNMILGEIQRALRPGGDLFSVHMGAPSNIIHQAWVDLFQRFQFLSHGCHPVDIGPHLTNGGFTIEKALSISRFGFPIEYIQAEKPLLGVPQIQPSTHDSSREGRPGK